jgi:asparagine synthase (glutamine-hydrolysing)
MRDRLAHRGPDHAGIWSSQDGQVCLGHRRLSIIDLSAAANQPFRLPAHRMVIVFNGEIYNYRELRRMLEGGGARFDTQSDTEVLLQAYQHWGSGCLDRLSGMFAFAIWDEDDRQLFCARDRTGEKPFYYAVAGGDFLFASEPKAFHAWPGFRPQPHYPALLDYLALGYVPDPTCIWEGVRKLPPGHHLSVNLPPEGKPEIGPVHEYWDWQPAPDHSIRDWTPRILETIESAAGEMMAADVPVGTFLSGGVDSSAVTAALARGGRTIHTFTVGFDDAEFDERRFAQQVAQLYRTEHVSRVVAANDARDAFEQLLWFFDEPFADHSSLPTYYLCREARREVTVALSGDGADEVFAGYRKYQRVARHTGPRRLLGPLLRALEGGVGGFSPGGSRISRMAIKYGADLDDVIGRVFIPGLDRTRLGNVARGPLRHALQHYSAEDGIRAHLAHGPTTRKDPLNALRYLDLKLNLAGDILVKVDRASMAVSLEVRAVFLNRAVLALAAVIPPGRLATTTHGKIALKRALERWLPKEILYRPKRGFLMPLERWLANELAADWKPAANSPLNDLLDMNALQATPSSPREAHSLYLLDRWLQRWAGSATPVNHTPGS